MSISYEFNSDQLRNTLTRYANLGFGVCWSIHMNKARADEIVSFSLVILMEHLEVKKTKQVELYIQEAMVDGAMVYYAADGREREQPTNNAVHKFRQV